MIVMKFGGTSVIDAAAMRRVADIVKIRIKQQPVVVVSAVGGLTNNLVTLGKEARNNNMIRVKEIISALVNRHQTIIDDLGLSANRTLLARLNEVAAVLESACVELARADSMQKDLLDIILSTGEYLSANIIAEYMNSIGMNGIWADARDILVTDSTFGCALPMIKESTEKARMMLLPLVADGKIPVLQGFIGRNSAGKITTLGRGGSDYTASLIGAMLDVDTVEIWSDVSGVLTADPSLVPNAKRILQMSFQEAAELAYFGAKVLHPATMLPAVEKGIAIQVLNSIHPEQGGTRIALPSDIDPDKSCIVKSIAYKEGLTVVTVHSTRMLMAHGFMLSIFQIFEKYKTPVDLVATSEVSVSITIDNTEHLEEIKNELNAFATVGVVHNKAIVCLVGQYLKRTTGMPAKIFALLGDVRIHLISQGASEINISFVIDESDLERVIKRLHEHFFANGTNPEIFTDNN